MSINRIAFNIFMGVVLLAMLYITIYSFVYRELNKNEHFGVSITKHQVDTIVIIKKDTIFVAPLHKKTKCDTTHIHTAKKQNYSVIEMLHDGVIKLEDLYSSN